MKTSATQVSYLTPSGELDVDLWLQHLQRCCPKRDLKLIATALQLCHQTVGHRKTPLGLGCVQQGINMVEHLLKLDQDVATLASALIYPSIQYTELTIADAAEWLDKPCQQLLLGLQHMEAVRSLSIPQCKVIHARHSNDNFRKMILAIATDVRVVLIKLVEYLSLLEWLAHGEPHLQQQYAMEVREIYAPLANRLGLGQIKWQLEDWCFRFLAATPYRKIANLLDERRQVRESFVTMTVNTIKLLLETAGIKQFEVSGRAKHIFSIYKKMQLKGLDYSQIYDVVALRVLVPSVADCYTVLSLVHAKWKHVESEYDDYIAKPKVNGYQSLHTAVIADDGRHFEVQIRSHQMHQDAELGMAAHWAYKEGHTQTAVVFDKAQWLRQVIAWESDIRQKKIALNEQTTIPPVEDRVYVFTPTGEVVDLPKGATVLDFAYYIHSDIGHRCRGAKVNGKIVPLSYQVNTAEQIAILTARYHKPSRDWINPKMAYLHTARARAKVLHWFKHQYDKNYISLGRDMLQQALSTTGIKDTDWAHLAKQCQFQHSDDLLIAIGRGDYAVKQVLQHALPKIEPVTAELSLPSMKKKERSVISQDILISGGENLMIHMAGCCKPIPGDPIVGYITKGYGISIHHQHCANVKNLNKLQQSRLLATEWERATRGSYAIDLAIIAQDRPLLIHDMTAMLANKQVNVRAIHSHFNAQHEQVRFSITLDLQQLDQLNTLLDALKQVPGILDVNRLRS